jgi:rhodanese-related sulfurtransferase
MVHLTAEGLDAFFRQHPHARTLDVRFAFEREHADSLAAHHVPWLRRDWTPDPAFLQQVLQNLSPRDYVLVLCHRGDYSHHAAALLEAAGFRHVYNLLGGYADIRKTLPANMPSSTAAARFSS